MPSELILLTTLLPWVEMNGSIPLGLAAGLNPLLVFLAAIVFDIAIFFPLWIGLQVVYPKVSHWSIVQKVVSKAERKSKGIQKWGPLGLGLFIGATPFPGSGVYTGTIIAWLLRMKFKHAFVAIIIGVLLSALIIFAFWYSALTAAATLGR